MHSIITLSVKILYEVINVGYVNVVFTLVLAHFNSPGPTAIDEIISLPLRYRTSESLLLH